MNHPIRLLICILAMAGLAAATGDTLESVTGSPVAFAALDGNADRRIDTAEWQAGRKALERAIGKARADIAELLSQRESGKISRFEAAGSRPLFLSLLGQARALLLAKADADGNGSLSDAEGTEVVARCSDLMQRSGARADEQGAEIDWRTQTATILGKVVSGDRPMFPLCDVNRDGQLTPEELDVCFDLLRAIAGD